MCVIYRGLFLVKCVMLDLVACREKQLFLKRINKEPPEKDGDTGRTQNCAAAGGTASASQSSVSES